MGSTNGWLVGLVPRSIFQFLYDAFAYARGFRPMRRPILECLYGMEGYETILNSFLPSHAINCTEWAHPCW